MERQVHFYPARDTRDRPGGGSAHGMELRFVVTGAAGAVEWGIYTMWMPSESYDRNDALSQILHDREMVVGVAEHDSTHALCRPIALGVNVHRAPKPGEETSACEWVKGGRCVTEPGSSLRTPWRAFMQQGDSAVWRELESRYHEAFLEVVPDGRSQDAR